MELVDVVADCGGWWLGCPTGPSESSCDRRDATTAGVDYNKPILRHKQKGSRSLAVGVHIKGFDF